MSAHVNPLTRANGHGVRLITPGIMAIVTATVRAEQIRSVLSGGVQP